MAKLDILVIVNNKIIVFAIIGVLFIGTVVTQAMAAPNENANSKAKEMTVVSIPENAKKIGDGVYDLGYKVHDGQILQGTLYVFSDKELAKPSDVSGHGAKSGGGTTCYSYISNGAKWKSEENWGVSTDGIPVTGATDILQTAASQWEIADPAGNAIFGSYDSNIVVDASSIGNSVNGVNEVAFGDIASNGVIAATWVWSTSGSPSQRQIVEWDQIYDTKDFSWSNSGESGKMDLQNIATHEIGHAAGMGHPSNSCTEETMYAYASNGETKKRDLNTGDIAGINKLY